MYHIRRRCGARKSFLQVPSVCLPRGETLAARWNEDLLQQLGDIMNYECRAEKAHVLLSPTINIPRTPLAGRMNELRWRRTISTVSGVLAGDFCRGVQEQGLVATPKLLSQ